MNYMKKNRFHNNSIFERSIVIHTGARIRSWQLSLGGPEMRAPLNCGKSLRLVCSFVLLIKVFMFVRLEFEKFVVTLGLKNFFLVQQAPEVM